MATWMPKTMWFARSVTWTSSSRSISERRSLRQSLTILTRMGEDNYLAELAFILQGSILKAWPSDLVRIWEGFVEECEKGYQWDVSEYNNEIRVRDDLDLLLRAPSLQKCSELAELRSVVDPIDGRFRALLQDGVRPYDDETWYRAGVLRYAGQAYAEYFRSVHGIDVEVVE